MNHRPYRGLTKDGKWVKGWYCEIDGSSYILQKSESPLGILLAKNIHTVKNKGIIFVEVIPSTVSQSTGLKDKNGREIFKGDIDKAKGVVTWSKLFAGFILVFTDEDGQEIDDDISLQDSESWLEVIGTIHDHLLAKGAK